jgi:conjugation system TraG family ATPase
MYNQYVFVEDSAQSLLDFEKDARTMNSLANYSRQNQINKEWIDEYLNYAHSNGLLSVRCHCNIFAWTADSDDINRVKNDVGSAIAQMDCKPRYNTIDLATLWWAGIPGNAGGFPAEERFHTFLEQAVCFFASETNYRSSLSPFGIKMVDRFGVPVHLDISDLPWKKGIIQNRNKFILGPSGSGKSFFTNHMVRQYYEQGTHIVLIDVGNSYQGLCGLINNKTKGEDGIYFTYKEDDPISVNPFYTDDGIFDIEKRESIKIMILALWKREDEPPTRAEEVALSNAVRIYIDSLKVGSIKPSFNTFYEFVKNDYRQILENIVVGQTVIPRNSIIVGRAGVRGERLTVEINTIEHGGVVHMVELLVHDLDGIEGIFIPNLLELNAAKEIVANMSQTSSQNLNFNADVKEQFVADMGRGVIQGISAFAAKRIREVPVRLQNDYKVYLLIK